MRQVRSYQVKLYSKTKESPQPLDMSRDFPDVWKDLAHLTSYGCTDLGTPSGHYQADPSDDSSYVNGVELLVDGGMAQI